MVPCFFEGTKKDSDGQTVSSPGYVMELGQQLSNYLKVDFLEDFRFGGFGSQEEVDGEDVEVVEQNEIEDL